MAGLAGASLRAADATDPRLTGTPLLRLWAAEDYDAAPVNWRVLVHPNGFVYVGNNSGVLEFDGARWRTRPMAHGGRASAIVVDERQRVWAGGHDEISVFEPDAQGALRAVDMTSLIPKADRPIGAITRALAMPDGVYLQSQQRIFRFHDAGGQMQVQVWRTPLRFSALFALDGEVYVQTSEEGLARIVGDHLVAVAASIAATVGRTNLNSIRPLAVRLQPGGAGWLLATTLGPLRWSGPGGELQPLSAESAALFTGEQAVAATFLVDGRIAFAMTRSGLVIFDPAGRVERRVHRDHGLPNNRIEALIEDPEGGLWLALHYGIARLQLDSPFALHAAAQGIEGGPRRMLRHWDRLYVAHSEGLSWRDPATGKFTTVAGLTIGANRLGEIGDRLVVTSGGLREVFRDGPVRSWSNRALFGVVESRRQPGWVVAAASVGLTLFAPKDDGWSAVGALANLSVDVETIHDSGDGWMWLASQAGSIYRVDFREGLTVDAPVEAFGVEQGVVPPRRSENVQIFGVDDTVAISSAEWLLRYDAAGRRFVPETRIPGLGATRGATLVQPGADGALWLRGGAPESEFLRVTRRNTAPWKVDRFATGPLQYLVANSIYEDAPSRTLWIAGQGSLVSMALDWRPARPVPPLRVHVRSVETGDGHLLAAPGAVRSGPTPLLLVLRADQNALRFEFAAPAFAADFRGTLRTQYRTRLDGFESRWSEWTRETHRDFTGLPFHALAFRVQARDLEGRESAEAVFAFEIAPPWWLSRWALGGYLALAGLSIFLVVRGRTAALLARATRLEHVVAERTVELHSRNRELARLNQLELDEKTSAKLGEQRALLAEEQTRLEMLRYQLNPHFLFNSLASISGLAVARPAAARDMIGKLSQFCRLSLARTAGDTLPLAEEFAMLRLYLDVEKTRWEDGLQVEFALDDAAREMRLPPFLLLSLVENAVKYGGQTSPDVLTVRVVARVEKGIRSAPVAAGDEDAATALHPPGESALLIEIANTGTWVTEGDTSAQSTHIGLANLRERLARAFPGRHEFTHEAKDGWVVVRLRIVPAAAEPSD